MNKYLKIPGLLGTLLLIVSGAQAQTPYQALNELLNSDFIQRFDELRSDAEMKVNTIKAQEDKFHPDEVDDLKLAYRTSEQYFNLILHNIRQIIITKEKRRYYFMEGNFDEFQKLIEADLGRAEKMYNKTFKKKYLEVVGSDDDAIIGALALLVNDYLPKAIELFKKIRAEIDKYNENLIEQYLIQPHKFRSWDEIN